MSNRENAEESKIDSNRAIGAALRRQKRQDYIGNNPYSRPFNVPIFLEQQQEPLDDQDNSNRGINDCVHFPRSAPKQLEDLQYEIEDIEKHQQDISENEDSLNKFDYDQAFEEIKLSANRPNYLEDKYRNNLIGESSSPEKYSDVYDEYLNNDMEPTHYEVNKENPEKVE